MSYDTYLKRFWSCLNKTRKTSILYNEIAAKPLAHAGIPAASGQPLSEKNHVTKTTPGYAALLKANTH